MTHGIDACVSCRRVFKDRTTKTGYYYYFCNDMIILPFALFGYWQIWKFPFNAHNFSIHGNYYKPLHTTKDWLAIINIFLEEYEPFKALSVSLVIV